MLEEYQVIVRERALQQDMYYKNQIVMRYTIKYPQFISDTYQLVAIKLNSLYRTKAIMYEKANIMNLYQMAMVEYEYSMAHNYPFHQFEAFVDYTITYNQNCIISLYFDQYEYAGGAHGLTVRYSDTWNLKKSRRIELAEMFPHRSHYRDFVIRAVNRQIEKERRQGDAMYFENNEELVKENFRPNNFYLSKEGVNIYFQQYDIAPYAAGIPVFTIPYGPGGAILPRC